MLSSWSSRTPRYQTIVAGWMTLVPTEIRALTKSRNVEADGRLIRSGCWHLPARCWRTPTCRQRTDGGWCNDVWKTDETLSVYVMNSAGPGALPWGTLQFTRWVVELFRSAFGLKGKTGTIVMRHRRCRLSAPGPITECHDQPCRKCYSDEVARALLHVGVSGADEIVVYGRDGGFSWVKMALERLAHGKRSDD